MTEAELLAFLKQYIKQEVAQIMMANVISNKDQNRSSLKRFPSDSPFGNVRNIQPFGMASRAPSGTQCLMIPISGDVTQIVMAGHFDENRPAINDGESVIYGADGQVIFMKSGGTIHQGTQGASSPVVLGDVLKTLMENVLSAFINNASSVSFDGFGLPCTLFPGISSVLSQEKSDHVDAASTNFLGQKNFVDRGAS
jgi:phage gp45-like